MALTITIEMIIKEAISRGVLSDLPGEGKPIVLANYNPFETKEDRLINRVIAASGEFPLEIIMLKQIQGLKEKLKECESDSEKRIILSELAELNWKYEIQRDARHKFYYG